MLVERITIQACCGKTALILKTNQPLMKSHMVELTALGFVESEHFTKAGLLYMDNPDFIITGPIGSDRLTVKCKHSECSEKLNNLEELLKKIG
jgi:hypothetical protein